LQFATRLSAARPEVFVPELPEVESIRRTLEPHIRGRAITRARIFRPDFCRRENGKPCTPRDLLQGATVASLDRRGKQLAIIANSGQALVVQLGMSGSLRVLSPEEALPPAHVHALWITDAGARVISRDPRRFGGLTALPSLDALHDRWAELGPDALSITGDELLGRAKASRRVIKAVLLDQRILAGVGNIYADEALFAAGINPLRGADTLTPAEYAALAGAVVSSLQSAIDAGGSTLRDYRDARGSAGRAQLKHAVYGRGDDDCLRCAGPLREIRVSQRATVFCPQCQPRRRTRLKPR
jgi:formamidopyrimidine-DNA glycosylase